MDKEKAKKIARVFMGLLALVLFWGYGVYVLWFWHKEYGHYNIPWPYMAFVIGIVFFVLFNVDEKPEEDKE